MSIGEIKGAWRAVTRAPAYALVAVLVLALGIGATTAVYAVLKTVVFNPLPYPDQDELVRVIESRLPQFPEFSVAPGKYMIWARDTETFEHLAMWRSTALNLTGRDEPLRLSGTVATINLFETIGVPMALGRGFDPADLETDANVVVLSHGAWMQHFGGDESVLGTAVTLNGTSYSIIGVAPPRYDFPSPVTELYIPWVLGESEAQQIGGHYAGVIGRLADGHTLEEAHTEFETFSLRLEQEYPDASEGWRVIVEPLADRLLGDADNRLYLLLAGVTLVLLITCANVAGLTLVRTAGRVHELAIRRTQGASNASIMRQLLVEGVLLALVGGGIGLGLAAGVLPLIRAAAPAGIPRIDQLALDPVIALVAVVVSLFAGVLASVVPAWIASRRAVAADLRDGGRGAVGSRRGGARGALVAAEVALAVVLLVAAAMLGRTMFALNAVDPGFSADTSIYTRISLPRANYGDEPAVEAFYRQLTDRAAALPGVEHAGVVQALPMVSDYVLRFNIEGRPEEGDAVSAIYYAASPDYLQTMGVTLVRGRGIEASDRADTVRVMVVSETFVERFLPDVDPIGQRVSTNGEDWWEIVGVVTDVRQYGLDARLDPQMYVPFAQDSFGSAFLVLRTAVNPDTLNAPLRSLVRELDADQPVGELRALSSVIADTLASRRFGAWLIGGFAAVAALLAAIGLYGTLAYTVRQTVREIGVRLALGAQPIEVLRGVMKHGFTLAAVGAVAGALLALMGARMLEAFVFGVDARDPITFGAIVVSMLLVALAASAIPAWRASRVNPMEALRDE